MDGLFCFKCLNIDCPADNIECQKIRSFVQAELKTLYYIGEYLDPCPQMNETFAWRKMQMEDDPCPEQKANEATCTLGRMQIVTTETGPDGMTKETFNHATVLGCANRNLLHRIKNAYEEAGKCDFDLRQQKSVGLVRKLEIEHCRDITKQCHERDYCIDWKHSEVKSWLNPQEGGRFDFTLKIGILVLVVVVMSAILIAGMFREPPSRPSNVPRSIGDESETVKVLQVRETKGLSSIEVEDGMNGTLQAKRPSQPPPPPPRLNRGSRGGTPV